MNVVDANYVNAVIAEAGHTRETYEGPFFFPENTFEIGDEAFQGCFNLKKLTLPNTVTHIGHQAFHGCMALQAFVMPNSVTFAGMALFHWCKKLEFVLLSKNLRKLAPGMFAGCESLKSIVIPENVSDISVRTFMDCESLKAINFLGRVSFFGELAFENTSVEFIVAPKPLFSGEITLYGQDITGGTLRAGTGLYEKQILFAKVFQSSLKLAVLKDDDTGNSEVILFGRNPLSFLPSTVSKTGISKALAVRSFVFPPINAEQQWLDFSRKLFPMLPEELRLIIIRFINGKSTAEFNTVLKTFDVSRAIMSSGALYDHTV